MPLKIKPYQFIWHVETEAVINAYLTAFLEEDGVEGFVDALGHPARKQGMSESVCKTFTGL